MFYCKMDFFKVIKMRYFSIHIVKKLKLPNPLFVLCCEFWTSSKFSCSIDKMSNKPSFVFKMTSIISKALVLAHHQGPESQ